MAKRKAAPVEAPESPVAEGYTVLARRYRPQHFTELVGQEATAQALANAIESNRVAHAYLFTGARGVGKTSTARILAKALNCEKGPTPTPCGQCEMCKAIASGDDMDVLEIDGASNRGIDEIRQIRQNVQFRPARARYKIYIIDEVHMLSRDAFNALLKTLEEPPPHVKFIFATTEVQKIPLTILSRCQRFDFGGISTARIVARLQEIVASEGMKADAEALELIARRAGGSMRDAQSLLDQLLASGETGLTADQVHRLLGTAHEERVVALAAAVVGRDAKQALEMIAEAADAGVQVGEILDQLIEYWRDLMVVACEGQALSVSSKHREALTAQARSTKLDTLLAGLDVLVSAKTRARTSNHPRVLLETALVRLSRMDDLVSLAQLAQWLGQAQSGGAQAAPPRPAGSVPGPAPRLTAPPEGVKKNSLNGPERTFTHAALTEESLQAVWGQVLEQAGPFLGSDLRQSFPAISGPNTLALRFPPGYNQQRERCQDPTRVATVEGLLKKVTGQAWNVRVDATPAPVQAPSTPSAGTDTAQARSRRAREEALQQPLLQRATDVLGAQVVDVDDDFGTLPPASVVRPGAGGGDQES